jgi:acyl-coenzyme A synthetase/AMP-(fatty) acid ligase
VVVTEPGSGLDGDTVREYGRARLRGSRTPDAVVFRTELPHTPTGKLLRRELIRDLETADAEA